MGLEKTDAKKGFIMMEYFHRQVQLWGEATQKSLQDKAIAIIGCGGLGSTLGVGLGSSGIGTIHLVDFDTVSVHNIHRQIAFKTGDENKHKANVLHDLIQSRCPYVKSHVHVKSFDEFTQEDIQLDLIIDATDNLPTRAKIDQYAKRVDTPWIYGSVEAFNGQVCFFDKSSFEGSLKVLQRAPAGIAAPIVMFIASIQANLALRYLANLEVAKDKLYYLFFNEAGELTKQSFNMPS